MQWKYYHTVWLVMGFGWVTNYMVRMGLSPALVQIKAEFGLSFADAGILAAAFFYAYTLMTFPAGLLGDWVGRRVMLILGTLGWAVASLATGLANSFQSIFALRFLTGLAEGSFFGSDRPVISAATPPTKMGVGQGLSFAGLGTGMGFGVLLAGLIATALGWRMIFVFYGLLSLVAVLLIWRFIAEPTRPTAAEKVSYKLAFTSRSLWMIYIGGMATVYALWVVGTWAPSIIMEVTKQDLTMASVYASLLGFAALPGLLSMGAISDYFKNRGLGRKFLSSINLLGVAIMMTLLGLAIETAQPLWLLATGIFVSGLFIWGFWAPTYSIYADIVPRPILGTAYGFGNLIMFISSIVAPWVSGLLRDVTGSFGWAFFSASILAVVGAFIIFAVAPAFRLGSEPHLLTPIADL